MTLIEFHEAIKKVCPIHGVSGDGAFDPTDDATPTQIAAAQIVADSFVLTDEPALPANKIAAIERDRPVTQRALREMILAIGAAFPQAQASVFYQKAVEQETAITALRAQI